MKNKEEIENEYNIQLSINQYAFLEKVYDDTKKIIEKRHFIVFIINLIGLVGFITTSFMFMAMYEQINLIFIFLFLPFMMMAFVAYWIEYTPFIPKIDRVLEKEINQFKNELN